MTDPSYPVRRVDGAAARHLVLIEEPAAVVADDLTQAHQRQHVEHVIDQAILAPREASFPRFGLQPEPGLWF